MAGQIESPTPQAAQWTCQTGFISDLIVRAGAGDCDAFARLVDVFFPMFAAARASMSASQGDLDDAVSRAFLNIWRNAPLYLPGEESAVTWIMQFAEPTPDVLPSGSQRAAAPPNVVGVHRLA